MMCACATHRHTCCQSCLRTDTACSRLLPAPTEGGMTWWCRMCDELPQGSGPFDNGKTISLKIKSKTSPGGWGVAWGQRPLT
jgi:hypothetical protein